MFDDHVVPVDVEGTKVAVDEGLRRGTSVESLARLKPSFREDGVIHAGNASQISDGAAALLITTSERAREPRFGLQTMCEGGGTANATLVELLAA